MRGASRASMSAAQDRLGTLVAQSDVSAVAVGDELFSVTDLLDGVAALRTALTDPSRSGDDKATLVQGLLGAKVSGPVVDFIAGMARDRWSENRDLADAIETLGADAILTSAQQQGRLDGLEDEIFRFGRVVAAEPSLRLALTDRALPEDRKAGLLRELLADKTSAETVQLVTRAITRPRGRSLEGALTALADQAAARRQRLVATVTSAVMLTQEQRDRLSATLAGQFGHEVHLNVVIDPDVIGGLRISLGDEVIDGSLASRLETARRRITR
jgi:F-type H+-transporting ATPase subunit delta